MLTIAKSTNHSARSRAAIASCSTRRRARTVLWRSCFRSIPATSPTRQFAEWNCRTTRSTRCRSCSTAAWPQRRITLCARLRSPLAADTSGRRYPGFGTDSESAYELRRNPPSELRTWPVIHAPSSLTRKATSFGYVDRRAHRPPGNRLATAAYCSPTAYPVSTGPGLMHRERTACTAEHWFTQGRGTSGALVVHRARPNAPRKARLYRDVE